MTGSSKFTDFLKEADVSLPIVNRHVQEIVKEVTEARESDSDIPTECISDMEMVGISLNLLHSAFVLVLSQQLDGKELENTDSALELATGLMNLAANQVMHRIPGIKEKIDSAIGEFGEPNDGDTNLH